MSRPCSRRGRGDSPRTKERWMGRQRGCAVSKSLQSAWANPLSRSTLELRQISLIVENQKSFRRVFRTRSRRKMNQYETTSTSGSCGNPCSQCTCCRRENRNSLRLTPRNAGCTNVSGVASQQLHVQVHRLRMSGTQFRSTSPKS